MFYIFDRLHVHVAIDSYTRVFVQKLNNYMGGTKMGELEIETRL